MNWIGAAIFAIVMSALIWPEGTADSLHTFADAVWHYDSYCLKKTNP